MEMPMMEMDAVQLVRKKEDGTAQVNFLAISANYFQENQVNVTMLIELLCKLVPKIRIY